MRTLKAKQRKLSNKDFNKELTWYKNKFAMKMDRTELNTAKEWCEGVNYGKKFTDALFNAILDITYTIKGRRNTQVLCIDWDKTEY